MTDSLPLHRMDPLSRFHDRAADYRKYRPGYPADAIAYILDGMGNPSDLMVADIGAGTGISAHLLADRGAQIYAIEPNAAMAQAIPSHDRIQFRQTRAEATELPTGTMDLVTCFQAFHWFEPVATLQEFHRILKPSGRIAVVWNNRDEQHEFTHGYGQLLRQASNKHPALERCNTSATALMSHPRFQTLGYQTFSSQQRLERSALIGLSKSRSYIPSQGDAWEQLQQDLGNLYERYADGQGYVYLHYETEVTLAVPI